MQQPKGTFVRLAALAGGVDYDVTSLGVSFVLNQRPDSRRGSTPYAGPGLVVVVLGA